MFITIIIFNIITVAVVVVVVIVVVMDARCRVRNALEYDKRQETRCLVARVHG